MPALASGPDPALHGFRGVVAGPVRAIRRRSRCRRSVL